MAAVAKQDSNITGLRYVREPLAGSSADVWIGAEPNSYKNFGGTYKLVARSPINASRQQKKGVVVDLDASGGFQSDLTYDNMQPWIEGLFFAAFRKKVELTVATVTASGEVYTVPSGGASYKAGDLAWAKGFDNPVNNGLKLISGSPGVTSVPTATGGLADAATQTGIISRVGFQFAAGDLELTDALTLHTTTKDFTQLGLIPGEWIYIGGDTAPMNFATAANKGWARIVSIVAHDIVLDKTENTLIAETSGASAQTVQLFMGRVVKNELAASDGGAGIVKIPFQFERTLGAPDDGSSNVQAEYLLKCLFNDLTLTINTADKITWDTTLIAAGYETKAAGSQKAGTRPANTSGHAFNTTSHVRRFQLALVGTETPLFAYLSQGSLTFNNNIKPNKAVSVLGAFDQSAGDFAVGGTVEAYFNNVGAVAAIPDNSDCTLDLIMCQDNSGIAIDLPLVGLGGGEMKIVANEPILLPLTMDAATAAQNNANTNFTAIMSFFDYLPTAAM